MTRINLGEMNELALSTQALQYKENIAQEMEKNGGEKSSKIQRDRQTRNGNRTDATGFFRRGDLPDTQYLSGSAAGTAAVLMIFDK